VTEAEEFASLHGLSVDEAELILSRRARQVSPTKLSDSTEKLKRALDVLEKAQKKVGVHPVIVQDGEVAKSFDRETQKNLDLFYASKGGSESTLRPKRTSRQQPVAVEDVSQDPEDYP
jgi:hypothetical protein